MGTLAKVVARWDTASMGSHLKVGLRCAPIVAMVKAALRDG